MGFEWQYFDCFNHNLLFRRRQQLPEHDYCRENRLHFCWLLICLACLLSHSSKPFPFSHYGYFFHLAMSRKANRLFLLVALQVRSFLHRHQWRHFQFLVTFGLFYQAIYDFSYFVSVWGQSIIDTRWWRQVGMCEILG